MVTVSTDRAAQTSLSLLEEILGDYHPRDFAVRLWDGTTWESENGQPARFTIVLRHPGALRQMFLPPNDLTLGEAYIFDDFDIEGDVRAVFPVAQRLFDRGWGRAQQMRFGARLLSLPKGQPHPNQTAAHLRGSHHSKSRDQQAISYHYDRSNDFYQFFLDKRMVYSCAYFSSPDASLDDAQEHKLEYICRKLRLKPGERLLDIGCGWGGLVIFAAQRYGVRVHGVTLSREQAALANERIKAAGLEDRCTIEIRDYREVEAPEGGYDKLVSVGMFEHVGGALLPTYFARARDLLRPGGVFLNHGNAANALPPFESGQSFVGTYVFPDGELVPISVTLKAAEGAGLEVRDVENLREHYALTLDHWVRNLEAHADEARRQTDDVTYRIWRLYMAGSIHSFTTGANQLFQTLLVKPDRGKSGLPLSRADWYR